MVGGVVSCKCWLCAIRLDSRDDVLRKSLGAVSHSLQVALLWQESHVRDNVHMPGLAAVRNQAVRRRVIKERGSVNNSSVRKAYRRVQRSHFPEGLRKHWTVLGLCQLG